MSLLSCGPSELEKTKARFDIVEREYKQVSDSTEDMRLRHMKILLERPVHLQSSSAELNELNRSEYEVYKEDSVLIEKILVDLEQRQTKVKGEYQSLKTKIEELTK